MLYAALILQAIFIHVIFTRNAICKYYKFRNKVSFSWEQLIKDLAKYNTK